jgi:Tfp pilus assembly protein PilV
MKRLMMILLTLGLTLNIFAASESSIRSRALFLTDKMAYELRLNSSQISDVYEINYDFFNAVGDLGVSPKTRWQNYFLYAHNNDNLNRKNGISTTPLN